MTEPLVCRPAELGRVGPELGKAGGQGRVLELLDQPNHLLKTYHPETAVDPEGLISLIEFRRDLDASERDVLDQVAAWPLAAVQFQNGNWGVVFQRAPGQFWQQTTEGSLLREVQFAFCEAATWRGLRLPPRRAAVRIARGYAGLLNLLHRHGVIYSDLNQSNLLWVAGRRTRVFLIDCDSAWCRDAPRGLGRADHPMWADRRPPVVGDFASELESDRFKLALLFVRLYYRTTWIPSADTPALTLSEDPPVTRWVADLIGRGLHHRTQRPTAKEWIDALGDLDAVLGRLNRRAA